jgi:hypothetical protein
MGDAEKLHAEINGGVLGLALSSFMFKWSITAEMERPQTRESED